MAVYYVDNAGSDALAGTSPATAWQHCSKVNSTTLLAGDQVRFTAGQTFTGPLTITNSGASGNYICIGTGRLTASTAGTGRTAQASPATITCPDGSNGINLNDCEYVSLDNLIITGSGVNLTTGASTATGKGISLLSSQTVSKLNGNRITACTVTGTKDGIWICTTLSTQKGYAGLQIWGCLTYALQRVSIIMHNDDGVFASGLASQNSDLYVGYCTAYDLPGLAGGVGVGNCGQGITVITCTTGLVEYCTVHDINIIGNQGPGGTQGFGAMQSTGITFRYNEAFHIGAPISVDGVGIDFETGANSCIAEYNYIHDCDGAGYLCGSTVSGKGTNLNVVRFNIFARNAINNEAEIWGFGHDDPGDLCATTFYCNTVYASHGNAYDNAGGYSTKNVDALLDNILVSAAGAFCVNGTVPTSFGLEGNLYYAIGGGGIQIKPSGTTYTTLAGLRGGGWESQGGSNGVAANPLLNDPTAGVGIGALPDQAVSTVRSFDLGVLSPARDAGVDISAAPYGATLTTDFHGEACAGHGANIGATIATIPKLRLPFG